MSTPDCCSSGQERYNERSPSFSYLQVIRLQSGLVDSLARPGGNITGFTTISTVLAGKRLELIKETVPKLSRVAVLWDPKAPRSVQQWKENQLQARELGLQLHSMEVSSVNDLENAFKGATKARSAALAVIQSPFTVSLSKTDHGPGEQDIGCRRYTLGKILSKAAA